jgi:hypothetical protein
MDQSEADIWKQIKPTNELDLNLMLTNTMWGNPEISPLLKDKLKNSVEVGREVNIDKDGKKQTVIYVNKQDLWSLLGFYTRDMRLGNLDDRFSNELSYVMYHLDLANDLLKMNFVEPFLVCLSRVATVLEISQSKRGSLRRQLNTFTSESRTQAIEPQKKNLFGTKQEDR